MIAQRYHFARDVKLLVLQAEISNISENIQINEQGQILLPSGTSIMINIKNETKIQELLNPKNWKKRRQLKDRVYEIWVGSSKYILKERKTARHTDTKEAGHKPGLSSLKEFETAQDFQKNGIIEDKNIKVNWENPVATVIFPDDFQFTVFEYEDGLIEEKSVTQLLAQEILKYKEKYETEFNIIYTMATELKDDPKVLEFEHEIKKFGFKSILQWIGLEKEEIPKLTFNEFATIKALRMQIKARNLMQKTIIENNYFNNDSDGYSYKINLKDGIPQLEIFGFDFEYFSKTEQAQIEKKINPEQKGDNIYTDIGFEYWNDGNPVTKMQRAGYLAMLQVEN